MSLLLAGCLGSGPCADSRAFADFPIPAIGSPLSTDSPDPSPGESIADDDDRDETQNDNLRDAAQVGVVPCPVCSLRNDLYAADCCRRNIAPASLLNTSCVLLI
jgi:hypothetical protein